MNREVHVRFWEGLAVRFRWATQLALVESIMRVASWSGQFLETFRSKGKFERSFKPDDTAGQVLDVMLLLGDGGGELLDFVG